MARKHEPLTFSGSLEVQSQKPLDGRRKVALVADLTDAASFPYIFKGLDVFCEENDKWYTFLGGDSTDANNWREEGSGSGGSVAWADITNKPADLVQDADYQHITVDSALDENSTNPVQNQAVVLALQSESSAMSALAARVATNETAIADRYTKAETDGKIAEAMTDVDNEHFHPVTVLPDPQDADETKRPKENHEYVLIEYEQDGVTIKTETHYLFYGGVYHQKPTGGISLEGYATEQYVDDGLDGKQDKLIGGLKGQVPVKVSAADGDMEWADVEDAFSNQKKYVIGDYVNSITNFTNGVSNTGVALHPYESRLFKIFHTVEGTATETICYVDERRSQTSTTPYVYHFEDLNTYGRSYTMDVSYNTVPRPNPNPQGIPPVIQVPQWTCDDTTVTKIEIYNATVTELIRTLPTGGSAGQVLVKQSAIDGDVAWGDASGGGENASFDVATIPQGPTGANEINAVVSNTDNENTRLSYIRQSDGTLPSTVNLGVKSGLGEDSLELATTGYVNSKALSPTGWGVARTGVATVTFNNSKWSSSATVDVSRLGFSSGADYDVVAQPTTGGTATPWGNAIAFVNADKGASSFSVSSVTMEESLSGTVNVKYAIFAKGYGAVAYTGEIPTGGATGQILTKRSDADGDYGWQAHGAFTTQGDWRYKINPDNTFEAYYYKNGVSLTIQENSGNFYRSALQTLNLPTGITSVYDATPLHASVNTSHNNYPCFGTLASVATNLVKYYALSGSSRGQSPNYIVTAHVFGTLAAKA